MQTIEQAEWEGTAILHTHFLRESYIIETLAQVSYIAVPLCYLGGIKTYMAPTCQSGGPWEKLTA